MTKLLAAALAAFALLAAAASVSASPTGTLNATFTVQFPKGHEASTEPCDPDSFCGVGTVGGYGAATVTILDETFEEIVGSSCLAVSWVQSIDLLDGSGSLVIEATGTFCPPGGSGDSHASNSSYGNPGQFKFEFTILGGESTGVFVGATGGGTETFESAGGIGVWHLSGEIVV
jgi:hypothetical protein